MHPTRTRDDDLDASARAAAAGDRTAAEALFGALADDVWRYCHALLGDRELAYDAAQETFLRLLGALGRWRGDAPVRVYVLTLARRASAEVLRKERRHRDRTADGASADRSVAPDAGAVEVRRLVAALPPDLREAFVLTQLVGATYEEAAAVADVAVGTIRSRVFRARERLVTALQATG